MRQFIIFVSIVLLFCNASSLDDRIHNEIYGFSEEKKLEWMNKFTEIDFEGENGDDLLVLMGKLYTEWIEEKQDKETLPLKEVTQTNDCRVVRDIINSAGSLVEDECVKDINIDCCTCKDHVRCNNGRITTLYFGKLSGTLPESIWTLHEIEELLLIGARADGSSLAEYFDGNIDDSLVELVEENASDNQLHGVIPPVGNNVFTKLNSMILYGSFESEKPPELSEVCPNIEHLVLVGNWYCDICQVVVPRTVSDLALRGGFSGILNDIFLDQLNSTMRGLVLMGNFEGELTKSINKFQSLNVLGICGDFSGPIPSSIGDMISLRLLHLEGYFYDNGSFPYSILHLKNLELLNLLGNFECEIPREIDNLTALIDVHFVGNFQGIIPDTIGNLKYLQSLEFIGNFWGDIPETILQLSELISITIVGSYDQCLPEFIGMMKNMTKLSLVGDFTCGIPYSYGNLTRLETLKLVGNLADEVPLYISHFVNITSLKLVGEFTGVIPSIFDTLTKLETLMLIGDFIRDIPSFSGSLNMLKEVQIVGDFNGTIPFRDFDLPELRKLSMCCGLSLPNNTNLNNLTKLKYLDLAGNRILTLSSPITLLRNLQVLILDHCEISELGPLSSLENLRFLSLSHNKISHYGDILYGPGLQQVDLSHNNLQGKLTAFARSCGYNFTMLLSISFANNYFEEFVIVEECPLEVLATLDVSNNKLKGQLSSRMPLIFPALKVANFSGNHLRGVIPVSFSRFVHMSTLDIRNNPDLVMSNVTGSIVKKGTTETLYRSNDVAWSCYDLEVKTALGNFSIMADDTFQKKKYCTCEVGYFGDPKHECKRCDAVSPLAKCPGEGAVYAPQGYWATPPLDMNNNVYPKHAIPCSGAGTSETTCRPDDYDYEKTCSTGYTGRLCSACENGWSHFGSRCTKCMKGIVGKMLFSILVFVLFAFFIVMSFSKAVASSGSMRVAIVFVQTLYYMWAQRSSAGYISSLMSYVGHWRLPGPACFFSWWNYSCTYISSLLFPCCLLLVVGMIYFTGLLFLKFKKRIPLIRQWQTRCKLSVIFVLYVGYVGFSSEVVRPMTCVRDDGLNERYMTNVPYEKCNSSLQISSGCLLLVVLGLPAGVAYRYIRRGKPNDRSPLRLLSMIYDERIWMWELVITGKRVLIILGFLIIPTSSVFQSFGIFLVLGVALFLQARYEPFTRKHENLLEASSLVLLLINYGVVLQYSSPVSKQGNFMMYLLFALDVFLVGACVGAVVKGKISAIRSWYVGKAARPHHEVNIRLLGTNAPRNRDSLSEQ